VIGISLHDPGKLVNFETRALVAAFGHRAD
jgi:hypothetical protein